MSSTPRRTRNGNGASRNRSRTNRDGDPPRHATIVRDRRAGNGAVQRQSSAGATPANDNVQPNIPGPTSRETPRHTNNETHPSGAAEQSHLFYELPRAMLPSIFGHSEIEVSDVRDVIRRLRRIQQDGRGRHRFHLIVESDEGELLIRGSERFNHVVTRVLFSPSVSLEQMHDDFQVNLLARVLNGISWRNSPALAENLCRTHHPSQLQAERASQIIQPRTGTDIRNNPENLDMRQGRRCPLPNDGVSYWTREICETLEFPSWFPYTETVRRESSPSSSELLLVEREAVEKFEFLDTTQVVWIYRELFEFLHSEAKKKSIQDVPRMFKYACFTPPWFRKVIVKSDGDGASNRNPVRLESVVLPDMRNQRSRMGAKRLAHILGAFYYREPEMAQNPLKHLLCIVPIKPNLSRKKGTTPRKRRRSEGARSDEGQQQRRRTSASQPTADTADTRADNTNANCILEIEDDDDAPLPRHRSARRIDEDPIDLEDTRNEGSTGTRKRLSFRVPRMYFGDSEGSQDRTGVKRNDNATGESSQIISHTQRNVDNPDAAVRSEGSEDSKVRRLFEEDVDQERNSLQLLQNRTAASGSPTEESREPNGDEDEEDIGQTVRALPSVQHVLTLPRVSRQIVSFPIVCAFGNRCRFKDNNDMQDSERITGRCCVSSCRAIMHDICGGGEDGDMTCPRCKSV